MRKNILFIVHQWLDNTNYTSTAIGGTVLHVFDLVKSIRNQNNCFVLYVQNNEYMLGIYTKNEEKIFKLNVKVKSLFFDSYDKVYGDLIKKILDDFKIDFIHIHHLLGHAYDVVDILAKIRIPILITLHDFFLLCPQVNMLYKNQDYCEFKNSNRCFECFDGKIDIEKRNIIIEKLFQLSSHIVVPNITVAELYQKVHKLSNYIVIEHGSDYEKKLLQVRKHKIWNIAFVGWMTYLKGSDIAKDVINGMPDKSCKFHLFGLSDDPFFGQNSFNYSYHGEYNRKELPNLLKKYKIDIVCLLTRCPETYCYTLSEVLSSGIPVIGFNIGAIGERINRLGVGWTVPLEEKATGVINKILEVKQDGNMYNNVLQSFEKLHLPTVKKMVSETIKLYSFKRSHKEWNFNCLKHSMVNLEEVPILYRKSNKASIFMNFVKRRIPYKVKRPIYVIIQQIKKFKNRSNYEK